MSENVLKQCSIQVGLPIEIVKKIEEIRGDIPRSAFLRRKIIELFSYNENNKD